MSSSSYHEGGLDYGREALASMPLLGVGFLGPPWFTGGLVLCTSSVDGPFTSSLVDYDKC